jgi:hypothetical protein
VKGTGVHNVVDAASSQGHYWEAYAALLGSLVPWETMNLTTLVYVCGRGLGAAAPNKFLVYKIFKVE